MLRFLMWRLLGLLGVLVGLSATAWLLDGGPGRALRGPATHSRLQVRAAHAVFDRVPHGLGALLPVVGTSPVRLLLAAALAVTVPSGLLFGARWRARRCRRYARLRIDAYRADRATAEAVVTMFEALHKRVQRRWWRRLVQGQPTVALEVHRGSASSPRCAWMAVTCPAGLEGMVEAALQTAYPNCRLRPSGDRIGVPPAVVRLKKQAEFIKRVKVLDHFEHEREPPVNRLITAMGACAEPAFVQIAMTPTPAVFERFARRLYKDHEARLSRARRAHPVMRDRSMVEDAELRGGLAVQHRALFFADIRVLATRRSDSELIAGSLRAHRAENRLVERGTPFATGGSALFRAAPAARRGQPGPRADAGRVRSHRAGGALAAAERRVRRGTVGAELAPARPGTARDPAADDGCRRSARRARPALDPRRAAAAERRRAGHRRAGQVELPRGERRARISVASAAR